MNQQKILLPPNTLDAKIKQTTEKAISTGALQPIPTDYETIADNGISFIVRILINLVRKERAKKAKGQDFNPFLPYEQDLFVADLSETHLCLLNKYNVVEDHLLIVTRSFVEQETLLNLADFTALWASLSQVEGLAFYNGGKIAGASVKHKHLQLVPTTKNDLKIPIESIFTTVNLTNNSLELPFVHAFAKLNFNWQKSIHQAAEQSLEIYNKMLNRVSIFSQENNKQSHPYNLLMTREWMLIVPRSRECYGSISINSLGFAGALLVRDRAELELVKEVLPMNILKTVARS